MTTLTPWSKVAHLLSVAARLDGTTVHRPARALPPALRMPARLDDPAAIPLSVNDPPSIRLSGVFANRRSHRTFAEEPVPLASVAAALLTAGRADAEWSSDEYGAGLGLDFFLLANRIEGVGRGVYHLDSEGKCLRQVPAELPRLDELILQLELVTSPAILIATASLLAAETRHGVHGYRLLLARASSALYAGWLAAIASGAVGCLFAGLLAPVHRLLRTDGFDRAALCALSLGARVPGPELPTAEEGGPRPQTHELR